MPSAATLKKNLYGWNDPVIPSKSPPVRVRLGDETEASKGDTKKPVPAVRPTLGTQEPKPLPDVQAASRTPSPDGAGEGNAKTGDESRTTTPVAAGGESSTDKKVSVYLPPPDNTQPRQIPKKVAETAEKTEPAPNPTPPNSTTDTGQRPPTPSPGKEQPKVFPDQKSALRTEGSGLFDTKGFPLGEYARAVIERIKGKWSIPSNLRQSQGRSTLIFFIEKDGTVSNLRIITSSGSQSLDLAALSAILDSKPLPPLPGGFPGEHVGAKFVFSYNEP
jgi:TonB family protein